ncbi:MAG: DNA polymerase/3'-5' exonuclease PolX [Chloroflexi bacterium]|nr:DNA polymerase/3'-5' exonuclease PolX [Chloroflexota bacterium]
MTPAREPNTQTATGTGSKLTNRDFAQVFSDITTLLQARGDSVFKIRAYSRAADTIDNLQFDLAEGADDEERLRAIPGFGDAIVAKVQELASTGRLEFFEKLKAEMPPGILEITQVPGIGPKTAMRAAQELGIDSREALASSIESGEFEKLPRMGNKAAQNILRHLNARISQGDRIPIGTALPEAERVMAALEESCPGIRNLTCAGSLRRHRETVGDIDMLCSADDPKAVMAAFTSLPMVKDVMASGATKSMVVMDSGLQFDLRVVPDAAFAATLLYFTGSKEHGIRLRDRAIKRGLSLNEYGAKNAETGALEEFASEEEVYRRLDLPYIPPEVREDSGEFDAAERGELPRLITVQDVLGDLHSHTDWTDGHATMEEMAAAARVAGFQYLAVTDHSKSATVASGLSVEKLVEHNEAVRALDKKLKGFRLLTGTEMDILANGELDYPDDALAELDIVLGSIHSLMHQDRKTMTARIIAAMENENLDIVAHLTTRLIGKRAPIDLDFDAVCTAAVETGTVLEINASTQRLDLKDTHIRRAMDLGVLFSIGTDSHRPRQFADLRYGVGMARRGWCTPERVINTLPYSALMEFISTHKSERYAFMDRYEHQP